MTQKISDCTEKNVINSWLLGKSRDKIAAESSVSTGSVSNIINKFTDNLGHCDVESIRELGIQIKKANLTPKTCANGFRISKILENIGIINDKEGEKVELFLKEIERFTRKINLDPSLLVECFYELIKISYDVSSPSQIINYIQQKKEDKERLESEVKNLEDEIRKLEKVKSEAEEKFIATKNKIDLTSAEINWYTNIKDILEKEGIPVEDISLLTRLVTKIKKYENNNNTLFPIFQILKRIDNLENLEKDIETKNRIYKLRKREIEILKEQDLKLLDIVHAKALKLDCLDEIEKMGFNFANLKK